MAQRLSAQLRIFQKKINVAIRQGQLKAARSLVQIIIDGIIIRTRLEGQGVRGPLPSLASSTKKYRQRYSQNLDSDTDPERSNATSTGQMLNALKGKASGTQIIIDMKTGRRRGELSGSKSKLTNSDVRKYYEEKMGEFLNINDQERKELLEIATEIIRQEILNASK